MKKIIEEQQRLSGVLSEAPGSGLSAALVLGENHPESDKTDPATPAPTSESHLQDKTAKERVPDKSLSVDESFSSQHEPLTPDSGCHAGSPTDSPDGERSTKKQRVNISGYTNPEIVLTHQILESSLNSSYQQPHSVFLTREQFEQPSGIRVGNEDHHLEKVTGSNL